MKHTQEGKKEAAYLEEKSGMLLKQEMVVISTGGIPNKLQSCLWFQDIGTCPLSFLTLVYFGLVKLI